MKLIHRTGKSRAICKDTSASREVVSRLLKYFEDEGIFTLSRGSLKIIGFPVLKSKFNKFSSL
jgi:hypothetical protein